MNCREAELLFGIYWDMKPDDPRRQELHQHLSECEDCAAEFAIWQESHELMEAEAAALSMDPELELRAEQMNRNVMERIYAETPWVLQNGAKRGPISRMFRRRMSFWIAAVIGIFLCSFVYLTLDVSNSFHYEAVQEPVSGIVPTGVATSDATTVIHSSLHFAGSQRGLIDPLVIQMDPTHPQYWMILSVVGMLLALVSLRFLARPRHQ